MNKQEVMSNSPPTAEPSVFIKLVPVTPPPMSAPPASTYNPVRAVTIPTESMLVTSSYVKVPAIET